MKNLQSNFAFTLAEVLVVLGIIGMIANMTIPTLMNNTGRQVEVTRLKKIYTEVNQALISMANDAGCPGDLRCVDFFDSDMLIAGNGFKKYFNIAKDCGIYNPAIPKTLCFTDSYSVNYDGSGSKQNLNHDLSGAYEFITVDGFTIAVRPTPCMVYSWYDPPLVGCEAQMCGELQVDVNGYKGPNILGRDIFMFWITNGKGPLLFPAGASQSVDPWKRSDGSIRKCYSGDLNGWDCTGRIMEEGWQMLY